MQQVDVLIIGSGPVGATFARLITDQSPGSSVLMVDLGPALTDRAGQHVKNIADPAAREAAQIRAQGPFQHPYPLITISERAEAARQGHLSADLLARPGTHLVTPELADLAKNQMPASSLSSNVGGMGAHWTGACPRPGNAERIPFIPDADYERAFAKAEELLYVTQNAFPDSPEGLAILDILGKAFNSRLSADRQVQRMPLACRPDGRGGQYWTGSDVILGDLLAADYAGPFTLRSETLCRQLLTDGNRVTGAILEHLPTGKREEVRARVVIVAADAIRTPQLLWASGIRPTALGRYLNEHPFIFTFVELDDDLVERTGTARYDSSKRSEPTIGVFWVPFDAPGHPFHGQIMHMDVSPIQIETHANRNAGPAKHIVGLGWGCPKEVRAEDHIVFSETERDHLGMPKLNFKFSLTARDQEAIAQAKREQAIAAAAFGRQITEGQQTLMPAGTSLHTQGTVRMGEDDDGTSVCDGYSQVWDFDNLFVGGNGVIPMATTSNPTLTSVAMAVRSCERIMEQLG